MDVSLDETLQAIRAMDDPPMKQLSLLAPEIVFRPYQKKSVLLSAGLKRLVMGDATGLGKTLEAIAAFAINRESFPNLKLIVICPSSAMGQWNEEFKKFSTLKTMPQPLNGQVKRKQAWASFINEDYDVYITSYPIILRDFDFIFADVRQQPDRYVMVMDEATAFKNCKSKTFKRIQSFGLLQQLRIYALTATIIKNKLDDAYSIFMALVPGLLGSYQWFLENFCKYYRMPITTKRGFKTDIIRVYGYKNLDTFRSRIGPYFIGHHKHEVAKDLPQLISRNVIVNLSKDQEKKLDEMLSGLLLICREKPEMVESSIKLTQINYAQQIINSIYLIDRTHTSNSAKEDALLDLLEFDFADEKVIVFTQYRTWVDRLMILCSDSNPVRITGSEDLAARDESRKLFQDINSPTKVIFVTEAGAQSLNLQAASAVIFLECPDSYGNFLQTIGRMVRIGSQHESVESVHLLAKDSVDDHIMNLLKSKKHIFDAIQGEAQPGALTFNSDDMTNSIFNFLLNTARKRLEK